MKILNHAFGDPDLLSIDQQIDQVISQIPIKETPKSIEDNTGREIDGFLEESSTDDVSKLFQNISVPNERISRYNVYDEVNKGVPLIKRILKVYMSNLIPKNPVDGKCIIYKKQILKDVDENIQEDAKSYIVDTLIKHDVIKKLKEQILPKCLLYGDSFVEIISLEKEAEKVDFNKSASSSNLLLESTNLLKDVGGMNSEKDPLLGSALVRLADMMVDTNDCMYELDVDGFSEDINSDDNDQDDKLEKEEEKKKNKKNKYLNEVLIRVHKPHNIVILETKYGSVLGYLEVSKKSETGDLSVGQNLSQVVDKITSMGKRSEGLQEKMANKLVFYILKKIIKDYKTKNKIGKKYNSGNDEVNVDNIVSSLGDDVYAFMKRLFIEQGIYKKESQVSQMKVRFISANRMVHFSNGSSDYLPYGESIIDGLILPAKLYMLSQLSNTVTKLSRASVIRKWILETGSTQMNAQLIQKMKREIYNSRVSIEDLSSFKSIPKILSDLFKVAIKVF